MALYRKQTPWGGGALLRAAPLARRKPLQQACAQQTTSRRLLPCRAATKRGNGGTEPRGNSGASAGCENQTRRRLPTRGGAPPRSWRSPLASITPVSLATLHWRAAGAWPWAEEEGRLVLLRRTAFSRIRAALYAAVPRYPAWCKSMVAALYTMAAHHLYTISPTLPLRTVGGLWAGMALAAAATRAFSGGGRRAGATRGGMLAWQPAP